MVTKAGRTLGRALFPFAVGIGLALLLHGVFPAVAGPFYTKIFVDMGINIILAVSLNLVNGFTGQFSLGHAGFMAMGGYVAAFFTYYLSFRFWESAAVHGGFFGSGQMLFVGSCILGGLVAAGFGWAVGLPSLRLRGDYLAIVTLGFGEILRVILQRTDGVIYDAAEVKATSFLGLTDNVGGALGFTGLPFYTSLYWVYFFVAVTLIVSYRLKESSYGRAFLAIRENEIAAEAMGVNTTQYKVWAFVISSFFAGIAGGLFAHEVGTTLNPKELGFQKSFEIIIMVVMGGMGSISGAVVAAILLSILPELLRTFAEYRMIVYALSLVILMVVRPKGIFGIREIWELSFRRKPPLVEAKGGSA